MSHIVYTSVSSDSEVDTVVEWLTQAKDADKECVITVIRDGCRYCDKFIGHIEEWQLERCVILVKMNNNNLRQKFYSRSKSLDPTCEATVPSVWVCGRWQSAGSDTTRETLDR